MNELNLKFQNYAEAIAFVKGRHWLKTDKVYISLNHAGEFVIDNMDNPSPDGAFITRGSKFKKLFKPQKAITVEKLNAWINAFDPYDYYVQGWVKRSE